MYSIKEYDIFVFDFDGTIMDTEFYHYIAWKNVLKKEISNFDLLEDDYFRMNHNLETSTFRNFLKDTYELNDYDRLYTLKGIEYKRLINQNYVLYMNSITSFFTHIKNHKKKIIMVTNSSKSIIDSFINNYPDLNIFDEIYTKRKF